MSDSTSMLMLSAISVGGLAPVIALLCCAIWLFRRTQIAGSVLMAVGYGGMLFAQAVSRMAPMTVRGDSALYLSILSVFSLLGLVCQVTIAIGFYQLCGYLIRTKAADATLYS